jgi:kinesin family protein 18/19
VRPLNEKELEYSNYKILSNNNKEILTYIEINTLTSSPEGTIYIGDDKNIVVTKYHTKEFEFDFVFDESTTQDEVYTNTTKMLLDNIMHGYNSTVFAYGATGSGKTYTMVGNDDDTRFNDKSDSGFV